MSLPPEKISELKQIIHSHLSQIDIQSHIKDVLSENVGGSDMNGIGEEQLLQALREKGVVDNVMRQIQFDTSTSSRRDSRPSPSGGGGVILGQTPKKATHFIDRDDKFLSAVPVKKANVDPTRRYLYLQLQGGKAFLEHLQDTPTLPGQNGSHFTVHVHFRGQRFKSRPTPCACEPDIQEAFLLELHKDTQGMASRMADNTTMLSVSDPVHLVLVKTEASGDTSIVSSHSLEWRSVLAAPNARCGISVELMGVGSESRVPVGLLEMRLELIPRVTENVPEDVIKTQVNLERTKQAERERLFLVYAKQWWREFLQIRDSHKDRLVKIFAQDENAQNHPVCWYVSPLRAGRLLDTPRQAARFTSLIGYERAVTVGGGEKAEQWTSTHAFLCRNKGDTEDHAVLLCCLLLGFGLDAYVVVGTKSKSAPHAWVMTVGTDGLVTFWESLTGHRYIHQPVNPNDPPGVAQPKPAYPYRTVGCVFSDTSFYANCQPSDSCELCVFSLHDESKWKAMSEDAISSVCAPGAAPLWPTLPPLCANTLDGALLSNDLEMELRALVSEHRRDQGLTTTWDDHLSYLLTPALAAYETERVTGVTAGNEEFQQAIRRAVPDGHTFKGYPIQFVHRNGRKAFAACLKSPVCDEIVNCRGDHVRIAVRVRIFTYPETACATWIMFACKYKSIV